MKKNTVISTGGKFQKKEMTFKDPAKTQGLPITLDVAKILIKRYWDKIKKEDNFAFTCGKEGLLSILAQDGCEGIRFYLGEKEQTDWGNNDPDRPSYWCDGITLVAIGVKVAGVNEDAPEIGVQGKFITQEIEKIGVSINNELAGETFEMFPPFKDKGEGGGLLDDFRIYKNKHS